MAQKGERYRNRYTGGIVVVRDVESVRIGPGETYHDVVVLEDGSRWRAGDTVYPWAGFNACYIKEGK